MGPVFPVFGEVYRRAFVDIDKVAEWMAARLPPDARVLDVGGGDGFVMNAVLARRDDIRVTMTDLAPQIGGVIAPAHRPRVELRPATSVESVDGAFDVMTLSDVVHHVPFKARPAFFAALAAAALRTGCGSVLIKDIQPGGLRARLAELGDHYITGDRQVQQLPPEAIVLPGFERAELAMPDYPNYGLAFKPAA
ncbi:MAG TPA: methyltransferase domain-containing protein [Caulobacteraceae bacterium]|nr:methyltransferase domain-containing protein [Caulobacteraceae bacterium]